jgi:hypothetical protein
LQVLPLQYQDLGSAVGMWESRVLGEISKSLWKPFCGFHRDVISIAVFVVPEVIDRF